MRILIEAHHPAHIHFFKNAVRIWRDRGDDVLLLGRDRDVMKQLLAAYDWIPREILTTAGRNNRLPFAEMLERQYRIARKIRAFKPSVVLSVMGSYTQSAGLLRVPNIVFTDSEFQHFNHRIAHPFATFIYTPTCFWKDLGPKQRRYDGYHELAFLHPARFQPRAKVLESMDGAEPWEYMIVRTSAWNTLHDIGEAGFGKSFDSFMTHATEQMPVFIVPEGGRMPERWERHRLRVRPELFHHALAYARLVVTEGASTASEAACLGVPAVYLNSTRRGYLEDQERRYGLVFNFTNAEAALREVKRLLAEMPDRAHWQARRRDLIADHVDVTQFVVTEVDRVMAG